MKLDLQPLARSDIRIGKPIPFPVYDRAGRLLLAAGQVLSDPRTLESLVERGLFVNPRWASSELPVAERHVGGADEEESAPSPEFRSMPPLAVGATAPKKKSRLLPTWRVLRMWSEGGSAEDAMMVKLIGVHEGNSIVITAPERGGSLAFVKEGAAFTFRGFSGELVYEFNASVQRVRFEPYPYLHVAWPKGWQVGKRRLREARRVRAQVPCILYRDPANTDEFVKGVLTDLSTGGASLQLKDSITGLTERVRLAFRLHVAGQQVLFEVDAKPVRLPVATEDEPSIGLAFHGLDNAQNMALHAYVYLQLVHEMETPLLAE
jgi:c-di-GMP-binding flagellar brake protein YcgR